MADWPDVWKDFSREWDAGRQHKSYAKRTNRTPWNIPQSDPNSAKLDPNQRGVVEIAGPVNSGNHPKYLTTWSDGKQTKETKRFLKFNWNEAWMEFLRRSRIERQGQLKNLDGQK